MRIASLIIILLITACTKPMDVENLPAPSADKNARFSVKNTPEGFSIGLTYSRYQFIPEAGAIITACKSLLTGKAYEEARLRNHAIQSINDQEVRVSIGRNVINARTSCKAFVQVRYKL